MNTGEAPLDEDLAEALVELSDLDPADAPDKAEELAAELAGRLDEAEAD